MFALIAALAFLLGLFRVHVREISWLYLGLFFIALHLLVPITFGSLNVRRDA